MKVRDERDSRMVWALLRIWAGIGLQSFGGGASTQLLIHREFVEKRNWIGAEEFGHLWNLCLFTPGINLIALTILIGRKFAGARGIAASLAGLLVPSAAVTCALAAGFETVQHSPVIHAILRGVIPATAGVMGVVAFRFARPLIKRGREEGRRVLGVSVVMMFLGALALIIVKLPVVALLVIAAALGAALFTPRHAAVDEAPDPMRENALATPDPVRDKVDT